MASKVNPLFQDSTISNGTNIRTQFELKKVSMKDNERLFLSLIDRGEKKYIELKCIDLKTGTYACSVWLKHKQEIGYQFFIKDEHKILSASEPQKGIAMYTLLETWNPVSDQSVIDLVEEEVYASSETAFVEEASGANVSSEDIIENLIEKWGL